MTHNTLYKDPVAYFTAEDIKAFELNITPGWYFYDENWVDLYGPHETESDATLALADYCEALNAST